MLPGWFLVYEKHLQDSFFDSVINSLSFRKDLLLNLSDRIRKKVPAVDSNAVPVAIVLWPPPWLADWPITHARDA